LPQNQDTSRRLIKKSAEILLSKNKRGKERAYLPGGRNAKLQKRRGSRQELASKNVSLTRGGGTGKETSGSFTDIHPRRRFTEKGTTKAWPSKHLMEKNGDNQKKRQSAPH